MFAVAYVAMADWHAFAAAVTDATADVESLVVHVRISSHLFAHTQACYHTVTTP